MGAQALADCDFSQATELSSVSPFQYSPSATGEYYFACAVGGHCASGQILTLTVTGADLCVDDDASVDQVLSGETCESAYEILVNMGMDCYDDLEALGAPGVIGADICPATCGVCDDMDDDDGNDEFQGCRPED